MFKFSFCNVISPYLADNDLENWLYMLIEMYKLVELKYEVGIALEITVVLSLVVFFSIVHVNLLA